MAAKCWYNSVYEKTDKDWNKIVISLSMIVQAIVWNSFLSSFFQLGVFLFLYACVNNFLGWSNLPFPRCYPHPDTGHSWPPRLTMGPKVLWRWVSSNACYQVSLNQSIFLLYSHHYKFRFVFFQPASLYSS